MSAPAPPRGQRLPAPSRHAVLSGAGTLVLVGLATLALYQGASGLELTLRSSLWQVVPVAGGLAWSAGAGLYALHLRALRLLGLRGRPGLYLCGGLLPVRRQALLTARTCLIWPPRNPCPK